MARLYTFLINKLREPVLLDLPVGATGLGTEPGVGTETAGFFIGDNTIDLGVEDTEDMEKVEDELVLKAGITLSKV